MDNFNSSLLMLKNYCETNGFKGWDPYDGLNSPITKTKIFKKSTTLRLIWIQFFKRFPINLRPIFSIEKDYNSKGIALFLSGYCNLYKIFNDPSILKMIIFLADKLIQLKNNDFSGSCWGYNFPWQNRLNYLPKGYPTVVTTSFAAYALMDAYDCTNKKEFLEIALNSCCFILNDLKRTKIDNGIIFSYTPMKHDCVYNASLLGSRLLSRAFYYTNLSEYSSISKESLIGATARQKCDGSWYYGGKTFQKWIDSFHTGFNLECISEYQLYTKDYSFSKNLNKGLNYYISNFFLNNKIPKYFNNKIYPIDVHTTSVLVVTLYRLGKLSEYLDLVNNCLRYVINKLQNKKYGFFYYKKNNFFTIKIPYMRWSQAWMFYALSFLSLFNTKSNHFRK